MNVLLRAALVFATAAIPLVLQASCARSVTTEGPADPMFLSPDATAPAPLTVCVDTQCPAPWASCEGAGACATDTSHDIFNCGACGHECGGQPDSHNATVVCANSKCEIACNELSADCNHSPADGCEVFVGDDPKNCGGCGITCKDGELCWRGACGCPSGFTQCGNDCKNLEIDDLNCGACAKKCVPPPAGDPAWICGSLAQPADTIWACSTGACAITCKDKFGNCNDDLCGDGCEVDEHSDPLNCGACGHACDAGQNCVDGACLCPPGTTRCDNRCLDLNADPDNCGACGNACPGAQDETANGNPTCTAGHCGYFCYAGYADCNNRINDGCEANVGSDAHHCGGCGTQCDVAQGQPCVLGQCLTKPCGPGPGTF